MIYTTYFANLKNLPKDIIPVSICAKAPDGYYGAQYKKLAPKYSFFSVWKDNHDNDYYTEHFQREVLDELNVLEVLVDLQRLGCGKDVVLVCYEKPTEFCHRHLVADWLNKNGIKCEEWGSEK